MGVLDYHVAAGGLVAGSVYYKLDAYMRFYWGQQDRGLMRMYRSAAAEFGGDGGFTFIRFRRRGLMRLAEMGLGLPRMV